MKMLLCGFTLALLALPASAQFQFQAGGTAGFGSSRNNNNNNNNTNSVWDNSPLGDGYFSASLGLSKGLSFYHEQLFAIRRNREGFSGNGIALKLETEAGYFGAGLGSYGWRGTGTRLFVGWPTAPHQFFEFSYTRLKRGGSTDPVFTYGVRF
jgi:hypothetical protein